MFTVCPKCALTLIVTAADLRAGQGYVRCGRCANVFNALISLSDDREAAVAPPVKAPPAKPADSDEPIPDAALEFDPSSTNVSDVFVEPEQGVAQAIGTGTFKMLVLRNADLAQTVDGAAYDPETGECVEIPGAEAEDIPAALRNEVAAAAADAGDSSTLDWLQGRKARSQLSPGVQRIWTGTGIALVVLFLAQAVHHYRNGLASMPALEPAIAGLYGAFGIELHPHWNLAAYEVRQLGATSDGADGGELKLRASIANRAQQAQPLPLLRVTMQDRFGNPIAARDVAPSLYASARGNALLASGQRVDAQIVFRDPGRNAVGFELDACLPMGQARIECALGQKLR